MPRGQPELEQKRTQARAQARARCKVTRLKVSPALRAGPAMYAVAK